ncbi:MAG: hypothetical protein QNK24_02965, partial [Desulfuromusa sp.]|nr:hypothetical protein [Desulfuromusa sp.]
CRVEPLGVMNYRLLATPGFISRWFTDGLSISAAEQAPAVIFNRKDRLHYRFLEKNLGGLPASLPCHHIPAPEQFFQVIAAGFSYGMVPDWQSVALRNNGELQELLPGAAFPVELYWHCWNLQSQPLQRFSEQLVHGAQKLLTP